MPIFPRPTVWQNEIGYIRNVTDPKHRYQFLGKHIPPSNPFLLRRTIDLTNDIFSIYDDISLYRPYLSSETTQITTPPEKKNTSRVHFKITQINRRPRLEVIELDTENIPIRFDFINDHPYFQFYKSSHDGDLSELDEKYNIPMSQYTEILVYYDIFMGLIFGNFDIVSNEIASIKINDINTKYHLDMSEQELIDVFDKSIEFYAYSTLDNASVKKLLNFVESIHVECMSRRNISVLQQT